MTSDSGQGPSTGLVLSPASTEHDTGPGHPEHAGRYRGLCAALEGARSDWGPRVADVAHRPATEEDLLAVHAPALVSRVREAVNIAAGRGVVTALDPDTRVSPGSWTAALDAAGAAIAAVDAVAHGRVRNAFVGARPPGHHATPTHAMGFCLFNNVAVAARWLQRHGQAERLLIVDWDVHHGNGTQDCFYTDGSVCYVSLHQWPHYPGTGAASETGAGPGLGYTVNVPLRPGTVAEVYHARLDEALDGVAERFHPDFVLVSAGFDVLAGDPLGGQTLEPEDLARITRTLMERADDWCGGRVVNLLEGGYVPERLGQGAVAVIDALTGHR